MCSFEHKFFEEMYKLVHQLDVDCKRKLFWFPVFAIAIYKFGWILSEKFKF